MRLLLLFFFGYLLVSCGQEKPEKIVEPKTIYLKKELTGLAPCNIEHSECQTGEHCVEARQNLGGTRQCIQHGQLDQFFGCTTGELIILPTEPWQLDCL